MGGLQLDRGCYVMPRGDGGARVAWVEDVAIELLDLPKAGIDRAVSDVAHGRALSLAEALEAHGYSWDRYEPHEAGYEGAWEHVYEEFYPESAYLARKGAAGA